MCDTQKVSPNQLLKNLFSDPTIGNKNENSGKKKSKRNNRNKKNIKYDRNISNMMRDSEYYLSLALVQVDEPLIGEGLQKEPGDGGPARGAQERRVSAAGGPA